MATSALMSGSERERWKRWDYLFGYFEEKNRKWGKSLLCFHTMLPYMGVLSNLLPFEIRKLYTLELLPLLLYSRLSRGVWSFLKTGGQAAIMWFIFLAICLGFSTLYYWYITDFLKKVIWFYFAHFGWHTHWWSWWLK